MQNLEVLSLPLGDRYSHRILEYYSMNTIKSHRHVGRFVYTFTAKRRQGLTLPLIDVWNDPQCPCKFLQQDFYLINRDLFCFFCIKQ